MEKIFNIIIGVRYRFPGNVIRRIPVEFEVYKEGSSFQVIPLCSENVKRITGLPDQLSFEADNYKGYRCKREKEKLMDDIVARLTQMQRV